MTEPLFKLMHQLKNKETGDLVVVVKNPSTLMIREDEVPAYIIKTRGDLAEWCVPQTEVEAEYELHNE